MTKNTQISFSVQSGQNVATLAQSLNEVATGTDRQDATQTITTSWTAVAFGPVTPELMMIQNLDATNYVQLATANDGTGIFARLKAGRPGIFVPCDSGATYYARANTASCKISILAAPV